MSFPMLTSHAPAVSKLVLYSSYSYERNIINNYMEGSGSATINNFRKKLENLILLIKRKQMLTSTKAGQGMIYMLCDRLYLSFYLIIGKDNALNTN